MTLNSETHNQARQLPVTTSGKKKKRKKIWSEQLMLKVNIYRCMLLFLDHILYRRVHFFRDALRYMYKNNNDRLLVLFTFSLVYSVVSLESLEERKPPLLPLPLLVCTHASLALREKGSSSKEGRHTTASIDSVSVCSDQPVRKRSLIRASVVRKLHKGPFHALGIKYI